MMALKVPPLRMLTYPSCGDVRLGYLEILLLKVAHYVLSNGSDVLDKVGNSLGRVEGPHIKGLLSE
jgi:hypothetical protein